MHLLNHLNMPVLKAEWIMNSPCQLYCDYCAIAHRRISEVSLSEKFQILHKFKEFNLFPVIYGGEVTLSKDFKKVLGCLQGLDIDYAIISNGLVSLSDLRTWIMDFGLKNWSVSIDTLDFTSNDYPDPHALGKSRAGWATLVYTEGLVPDRVANITVSKYNYKEVENIVKKLSSIGVWSLFNLVNTWKPGFDFSSQRASESALNQRELDEVASRLLYLRKSGGKNNYLIHNSPETFLMWSTNGLKQDWHCSRISKIVIDCDGALRCCVDWKGNSYGSKKFVDLDMESFKEMQADFLTDINQCKGCAWSSTKDSEVFQESTSGEKMLRHN